MKLLRPILLAAAVLVAGLLMPHAGWAVDRDWNKATGVQVFNDAANWTPSAVPTDNDNLTFGLDGDVEIFLGAPSLADNLTFSDGAVEFRNVGGSLLETDGLVTIDDPAAAGVGDSARVTLNGAAWDVVGDTLVGDAALGSLTVSGGGVHTTQDLFVGNQAGSVGEANVSGAGSRLVTDGTEFSNGFFLGNAGVGTLNVTAGGVARIQEDTSGTIADLELGIQVTGNGTLNLDGAGSQFIAEDVLIGREGVATVNITGGGRLLQNIGPSPDAAVAEFAGSLAAITVNGAGSRWEAERIRLGMGGVAILSIENGGFVRNNNSAADDDMTLGLSAGGSGLVAISGTAGATASRLEADEDLIVGASGLGELRVGRDQFGTTDGNGRLTVGQSLLIGTDGTSTENNRMVVDGPNAVVEVGNVVFVGDRGRGTLEVRGGGSLTAARPRVGSSAGADGTLLLTGVGSTLTATTDLVIATNGTGGATVSDDAVLNGNGNFWVGYQADAVGTLTIDGGEVNAGVNNAGTLLIGGRNDGGPGGAGTVTVQNGGRLTSAIDTTLGGNATSAGTLTVTGAGSVADLRDASSANDDVTTIGSVGGGVLNVLAGGRLDAEALFLNSTVGNTQDVSLNVDGAGTTVNVDGGLVVGNQGVATVTISGGAQVSTSLNPDGNLTNRRVIVGNGSSSDGARLTLTGAGTRLDHFGDERISVGFNGGSTTNRARLDVLDGAVLNAVERDGTGTIVSQSFVMVGDESGGNGVVSVSGAGSRIDAEAIYLGNATSSSSGVVSVADGGVIAVTGVAEIGDLGTGNSSALVTGAGSRLEIGGALSVGSGAADTNGVLNVTDGGTVTSTTESYIGRFSGSNGTVIVGGGGAQATLQVGDNLILAGDRTVFSDSGSQTSGSGTLTVLAGGLVEVTDRLYLKDRAVLNLDGGELATDNLVFQDSASRTLSPTVNFNAGTIRYTDNKTLAAADLDQLFDGGPAVLVDGKHLAFDAGLTLSEDLRVDGGELSIGSPNIASFKTHVDFDAGTLNLTDSGLVVTEAGLLGRVAVIDADETVNVTNSVFVQPDGLLNVAGGALTMGGGTLSAGGSLVVAGGSIDFGNGFTNEGDVVLLDAVAAGTLFNNGDLTLVNTVVGGGLINAAGGALSLGIGSAGTADLLDLSSAASLAGTLNVSVDDSAALSAGDRVDVILADGGVTGTFDSASLPTLDGGLSLQLLYEANRVSLLVVGGLPGDYNGDGAVDAADYTVWRDGGAPDSSQAGYDLWAANFGATATSAVSNSNAVPEPSAALTMAVACLGVVAVRRL